VKTVNAHLSVGKYGRLTIEITDYKIVALEYVIEIVPFSFFYFN
jgi:hypothetical protein